MTYIIINGTKIDMTAAQEEWENRLDANNLLMDDEITPEDMANFNSLPDDEDETPSVKERALALEHKIAYLMDDSGIKAARALPGESLPSANPGATRLREYWVHGEGAAKIQWGVPDDFYRCVAELEKYVGVRAKGLCNIYHREALGVAPGQEGKVPHPKQKR